MLKSWGAGTIQSRNHFIMLIFKVSTCIQRVGNYNVQFHSHCAAIHNGMQCSQNHNVLNIQSNLGVGIWSPLCASWRTESISDRNRIVLLRVLFAEKNNETFLLFCFFRLLFISLVENVTALFLSSSIAGKNKDDIQKKRANKCFKQEKMGNSFFRHQICIKKDLMHKVAFGFSKSELDTNISFNFSFSLCETQGCHQWAPESSPDGADVDGRGGEEPTGYHGHHHHGLVVVLFLCRCSSHNSVYTLLTTCIFWYSKIINMCHCREYMRRFTSCWLWWIEVRNETMTFSWINLIECWLSCW